MTAMMLTFLVLLICPLRGDLSEVGSISRTLVAHLPMIYVGKEAIDVGVDDLRVTIVALASKSV
jgi:hypothetical protein